MNKKIIEIMICVVVTLMIAPSVVAQTNEKQVVNEYDGYSVFMMCGENLQLGHGEGYPHNTEFEEYENGTQIMQSDEYVFFRLDVDTQFSIWFSKNSLFIPTITYHWVGIKEFTVRIKERQNGRYMITGWCYGDILFYIGSID